MADDSFDMRLNAGPAQQARTYSRVVGDGKSCEVEVAHNLGTRATLVSVTDLADGLEVGSITLISLDVNRVVVAYRYMSLDHKTGEMVQYEHPIPLNGWLVRVYA